MEQKQLVLRTTTEPLISESNSMTSATLGRVMNTLLTTKPKKLLETISHLDPSPKIAPIGGNFLLVYSKLSFQIKNTFFSFFFLVGCLFFLFFPSVSLEQSLLFLYKYVKDAAEKESSLDQVLVPMIQHVRTSITTLFVCLIPPSRFMWH